MQKNKKQNKHATANDKCMYGNAMPLWQLQSCKKKVTKLSKKQQHLNTSRTHLKVQICVKCKTKQRAKSLKNKKSKTGNKKKLAKKLKKKNSKQTKLKTLTEEQQAELQKNKKKL